MIRRGTSSSGISVPFHPLMWKATTGQVGCGRNKDFYLRVRLSVWEAEIRPLARPSSAALGEGEVECHYDNVCYIASEEENGHPAHFNGAAADGKMDA